MKFKLKLKSERDEESMKYGYMLAIAKTIMTKYKLIYSRKLPATFLINAILSQKYILYIHNNIQRFIHIICHLLFCTTHSPGEFLPPTHHFYFFFLLSEQSNCNHTQHRNWNRNDHNRVEKKKKSDQLPESK